MADNNKPADKPDPGDWTKPVFKEDQRGDTFGTKRPRPDAPKLPPPPKK
ncbi:hypothetical protein [Agromyces bauzanensis]